MAEILFRLGRLAARRARLVVAAWVAVLALAGVAFAVGGGTLTTALTIPNTPTAEVTDQLEAEFPSAAGGTGTVVLSTEDGSELTEAQREELSPWLAEVTEVDGVEGVIDPFQTEAERAEQQQALEAGQAQIEDGRAQIEQGRAQIEDGAAQLEAGRAQLDAARAELEQGQAQLDAAREQAEAAGAIDQAAPQLDAQQAEIDAGLAQLEEQQAVLEAQEAELEAGRAELEEQAAALEEQATEAELGAELLETAAEIRLVSEDGSAAIANLSFSESQFEITQETKDEVMEVLGAPPVDGVESSFGADIATATPELLGVGEAVGVVVAAIVLLVMLGTLIGAGLPILTALIGVGIGALGALSLSGVVEMVSVTPVLGLMLGLAVGIDYSLFIINRHRRQLKQGYDVEESIGLANGTSGNAVVFAGATVLIALLGLNITGIPFLGLMGTVAAFCVAIAVMIAVTMTPALLSLVGRRILSTKERAALAGAAGTPGAAGAAAPSPVAA
ncbi:MMPL family transporter, partial [Actinotalea sp. C106]|uniref:MMPL family transporter n=1 Tax=Actinotalea sp. C106 TaxID=2908644 RepID=UPI0020293820